MDVAFIKEWQTLIGSFLGPFLAILLSGIAYSIKLFIENRSGRKENLRLIEISTTRSLNESFKTREELRGFAQRIKDLSKNGKNINDDKLYFLDITNFPPLEEIYRNKDLSLRTTNSYYLHNKLLFVDAGINRLNKITDSMKEDFYKLISQNEFLIALREEPKRQRIAYTKNLDGFADFIEKDIILFIDNGIKLMAQIKVYNELLRKKMGFITLWRYEGSSFKFYYNKKENDKFNKDLDSLDRIDKIIEPTVENLINEAGKRLPTIKK